jgi:hypothetical protein
MTGRPSSNLILGLCCVAFAALVLFVWIPLDSASGIVQQVRRHLTIGDGLAPTVAAVFVLIGGLVLVLVERNEPAQPRISGGNIRFIGIVIGILIASLLVMRFAGPVTVYFASFLTGDHLEYRLLRDTWPWKYVGYLLGGTMMIAGLIAQIDGRLTVRSLAISVLAVLVLIAVYDLPFDDLLLPPNGDV